MEDVFKGSPEVDFNNTLLDELGWMKTRGVTITERAGTLVFSDANRSVVVAFVPDTNVASFNPTVHVDNQTIEAEQTAKTALEKLRSLKEQAKRAVRDRFGL